MLSIAYGRDQRGDALHAHRPEYCYEAQGFAVRRLADESVMTAKGPLPVRRLFAQRGLRHEPITYWTTIGERVARPGIERKLAQLRFGFARSVPDGMLVRVSSLDADPGTAQPLQDRYIRDLQQSLSSEARRRLT